MPWTHEHLLEFPDQSFDFVTCAFALFLFPDMNAALAEMYRVFNCGIGMVFIVSKHYADSVVRQVKRFASGPHHRRDPTHDCGGISAAPESEDAIAGGSVPESWML
jgi:SAM-dependent methyltransferase